MTGTITASEGLIAGWTIESKSIFNSESTQSTVLYTKGHVFDVSYNGATTADRTTSMGGLMFKNEANSLHNRVYLAIGETYDAGLTREMGISFTRGKVTTTEKYFQLSATVGDEAVITANIAGWDFD